MANVSKGHEMATIDCAMIVLRTDETTPRVVGSNTETKIAVEADLETNDAIKLIM